MIIFLVLFLIKLFYVILHIKKQFPNPVKYRAVVQAKVKMMRNLPLKHKENGSDVKPIMQEKGIYIFAQPNNQPSPSLLCCQKEN